MASAAAATAASGINTHSVNFLRWGALAVGVYWGWSRKSSLTNYVKVRALEEEKKHNEHLIEEGKVAFEAAYNREQAAKADKAGIAIDSDSYRFVAERWLNWAIADADASAAKTEKKK